MTSREILDLLGEVLELSAAERESFLDRQPEDVRATLEEHLQVDDQAEGYFEALRGDVVLSASDELERAQSLPRFGAYQALRQIGRGGMGRVYLAERDDGQFQQRVAIKVLRRARATADLERRFLAERQILAGLEHPNIARLQDGGVTADGQPYFVMEFIDGQTLTEYCDANALSVERRLELFLEACSAVQYAHRRLVVHRDLKPSNVLVSETGEVKLVDFGIARLLDEEGQELETDRTLADSRAMTPEFAAPEQLVGGTITTATDVYALGVVLFELLGGVRPFVLSKKGLKQFEEDVLERPAPLLSRSLPDGEDGDEVARARSTRPDRLSRRVAGDLETICDVALRKEPESRYSSVEEMARDVRRHLGGRPVSARRASFRYRARKFLVRNRVGLAVAAAFAGLVLMALVVLANQVEATSIERDRAEQVSELLLGIFEGADPSEARGREVAASELVERAARRMEGRLGEQPETRASLLEVLGRVFGNLGLYSRAQPLLEESLELRLTNLDPNHQDVIASRRALGELLRLSGESAAALLQVEDAKVAARSRFGPVSAEFADLLDREGRVRIGLGEFDVAREALDEALRLKLEVHGDGHEQVAETYNSQAVLALLEGRFDEAERLLVETLEIREQVLGEDHPLVPGALNNLATALSRQGRPDEAAEVYGRALAIYGRVYAPDHPRTATARNNLGLALFSAGRAREARGHLEAAVEMRRAVLEPEHPDLAQSLSNLGLALQQLGDYDLAAQNHEQALRIRRDAYGEQDPRVGQSLNNLGLLARDRGELRSAESSLIEALGIMTARLGESHPAVGTVLSNLGDVRRLRRDARAQSDLERALGILRAALPEGHVNLSYPLLALGQLRSRVDLDQAHRELEEALSLRVTALGEAHWQVAEVRVALAEVAAHRGVEAEVQRLAKESWTALEAAGPQAATALDRLIQVAGPRAPKN